VFDKTGTLTEGRPALAAVEGRDARRVLGLAWALQQACSHPLARAVAEAAQARGIQSLPGQEARALPGRGMQARVGSEQVWLGNRRLLDEIGAAAVPAALDEAARRHELEGRTVSWLAVRRGDETVAEGLLAFGDRIKASSAAAVARLRTQGIEVRMLTGDNGGSARAVAGALGIEEFSAEVLPGDKARVVQELVRAGRKVAMVGDGINDAPALAAADVGIAMAGGTEVAMHTAGITLMRGDPLLVADAIEISRRTWRKIRQNLGWAFVYNLVGIPVAAFGLLNPVLAGAAMALSSVSVVTNALLLRGWRPQAGPAPTTIEIDQPKGETTMYELTVEDMSCGHCVGRVTKAVQQVDGDAKVAVDLPTKKVKIDSQADLDKIATAISEAGYPVSARTTG
jgi:Cu+-exporting ATPase